MSPFKGGGHPLRHESVGHQLAEGNGSRVRSSHKLIRHPPEGPSFATPPVLKEESHWWQLMGILIASASQWPSSVPNDYRELNYSSSELSLFVLPHCHGNAQKIGWVDAWDDGPNWFDRTLGLIRERSLRNVGWNEVI